MSIVSRLLRGLGVWIAPVALLILVTGVQGLEESGEGYHTAVVLTDISAVTFIAPLVALAAAWEGSKLRFSRVLGMPQARSTARIVLGPLAVSVVPAAVVMTLYAAFRGPASSATDWLLIVSGWVTILAWATVGLGLGAALSPVVALPIAMLVPALWLIFARVYEPLWLRHLTGAWTGCCFTNQTVSPRALASALTFNTAVWILGVLIIWAVVVRLRRPNATRGITLLAVAVMVVSSVVAANLASSFNFSPGMPRTDATVCDDDAPMLCLWPEHEPVRAEVRSTLDATAAKWREAGVTAIPAVFDEGLTQPQDDGVPLVIQSRAEPENWVSSLAYAAATPACGDDGGANATQFIPDSIAATAWLTITAGTDASTILTQLPPPVSAQLTELLQDPKAADWISSVMEQREACS